MTGTGLDASADEGTTLNSAERLGGEDVDESMRMTGTLPAIVSPGAELC